MKMHHRHHNQQGSIILIGIVFMAILMTMSAAIWGYTMLHTKASRQALLRSQALHLAEAGLDKAVSQLNLNQSYTGEGNTALGAGVFTTSVSSIDPNNKQITSTAYIPNSSNPQAEVTVKMNVSINLAAVAFNFGVQVGAAGLQMDNNSVINGNVYSNGDVTGANAQGNNSRGNITGDVTVAGGGSATVDQECTATAFDFAFNQSDRKDVAQKFTPSVSGPLTKVSVYLKKVGAPGDITVRIATNNASNPSNTQIGGSGTISSSQITGNYGWANASFSSSPILTANTAYWIILDTSNSSSSYYVWAQDGNGTCYGDTGSYTDNWNQNNASWTGSSRDYNFQTYMGGANTVLDNIVVGGNARAHILKDCLVTGDGYFQTNNGCTVNGVLNSGAEDSPPQELPISQAQIDEWEDTAESGGTIDGDYTVNGSVALGPKKIDGDLTINGTLYMTGPVWVVGNITINLNAAVRVDASVGAAGTVLIADNQGDIANSGYVDIANNVIIAGNNFPGSYPMIFTTKTGDAMRITNNAVGAIFYASGGILNVLNNAGGSQLTGYGIHLAENSTITYSTGLQSTTFANGPGGSWALVPGTYVIIE